MNAYKSTACGRRRCASTEYLSHPILDLSIMSILQPEKDRVPDVSNGSSCSDLFSQEQREELVVELCERVLHGLLAPHQVPAADVCRIVRELVEEIDQGPFKRLHIKRNADGSFRPFCTGCDTPQCCIIFETIRLTADDARTLSLRFAISPDAFLEEYCDCYTDPFHPEFAYKLKRAKPCGFLDEGRCSVYTDRPERCRHFPLQRDEDGQNFTVYPWCNYFTNLLWHEATLRVFEYVLQNYQGSRTRMRCGGVIHTGSSALS